jgi:hypothetical protein
MADYAKKKKIPDHIFKEFMDNVMRRYEMVQTQLGENPFSMLSDELQAYKKLTLAAIKIERETLISLRKSGEIHDEIFRNLADELDIEELRAKSLRV